MTEEFDVPDAFKDDALPEEYCPSFEKAAETFVDYFRRKNKNDDQSFVFSINGSTINKQNEDNEVIEDEESKIDVDERSKYFKDDFFNNDEHVNDGKYFDKIRDKMTNVCANGKVKKRIKFNGNGKPVPYGARVIFDYMAYLDGSRVPFDATLNHGKPFCVTLEQDSLLYGLQLSIYSMTVGETSQFLVHYDYAYLESGHMDFIPPKSHVLFEIHLISVFDAYVLTKFGSMSHQEKIQFENAFQVAQTLNEKGNHLFKSKVTNAIKCYNEAINVLEDCCSEKAEQKTKRDNLLIKLLIDVAICYNRNKQYRKAADACKKAYKLTASIGRTPAKLFYHDAKALSEIGELKIALNRIQKAMKIVPNNEEVANLALHIKTLIKDQTDNLKKFSKILINSDESKVSKVDESEPLKNDLPQSFYNMIQEACNELTNDPSLKYYDFFDGFLDSEIEEMKRYVKKYDLRVYRRNKYVYITREDNEYFTDY